MKMILGLLPRIDSNCVCDLFSSTSPSVGVLPANNKPTDAEINNPLFKFLLITDLVLSTATRQRNLIRPTSGIQFSVKLTLFYRFIFLQITNLIRTLMV